MKARDTALFVGGILALTAVLFLSYAIAAFTVGLGQGVQTPSANESTPLMAQPQKPEGDASELGTMLLVFFADALAIALFTRRSVQGGWILAGSLFLVFFGHNAVLTQIESLVFLRARLSEVTLWKIAGVVTIVAFVVSPLAVLLLRRTKRNPFAPAMQSLLRLPWGEALLKTCIVSATYLVLYLLFGYFVAWKQPAVQAYYGGTDPGSFFALISFQWQEYPWMFALQLLRGALWVGFAYPLLRLQESSRAGTALACALLFSVWSLQLLFPNPFMPQDVRMIHLRETLASNSLFGAIAGWLFARVRPEASPLRTPPHNS